MTQKNNENELPDNPPKDEITIRCPRLGHQISFSYCQYENNTLPCFKSLDCWHSHFNVHAYLKNSLTQKDFENVFLKQSKPKLFSLLDLIEQAKKNQETSD